jgi:hypothetical protein
MRIGLIPLPILETPDGVYWTVAEAQVIGLEMEKVAPKVPVLFDRDDVFYSELEKATDVEVVSDRAMRVPLEMRPGGYFGQFNPDDADLGVGDGPQFDKGTISVCHLKYAVQWSKLAEWGTNDKRKAVVDAFERILASAMPEFRRNVDALCQQSGSGVLGTVSAVTTTTLTNDTYALSTDGFGAKLMRFGQFINVYDTTLATQRTATGGEAKIVFYDLVNKSIQVDRTVTGVTATDKCVISGVSGASPVSLLGIPYHATNSTSGTWLGFTRSTTPEIRANRVNANGALALPFARLAINKIGDRVGIKERKMKLEAWMHPAQVQAYEQLGQLVQFIDRAKDSSDKMELYFGDGENMQMAGAKVRPHFLWDKTRIDFINTKLWGRSELYPAGFYKSKDGRRFFELRGPSGGVKTSDVFYLCVSFNLYAKNPAAIAYIDGLTVPSGY